MSDVLTGLRNARRRIANEGNWTQGAYARNVYDLICLPTDKDALKFCAVGALCAATNKVLSGKNYDEFMEYLTLLAKHTGEHHAVSTFNDKCSHKDVLELFDKAIADLEKEQANV